MTEYLKLILIALVTIAILILPSSALVVCNYSGEDPDWGTVLPCYEAEDWYEYGAFPAACDSNVTTGKDTPVEITLTATDPDDDMMTYRIDFGPLYGTVGTITGNTVVYTPNENYTGVDSFSFSACDGTWDSNTAMVTITIVPDCSSHFSHAFYGTVTIDGEPAPEHTVIVAAGPGILPDTAGNPVTTQTGGFYGSAGFTAQNLVVQGCIEEGTPVTFYADGIQAEVYDVGTSGPWQSTCLFRAGEVTNLDIRITQDIPPPDEVYINAIEVIVSNETYGFLTTITLEKDPWVEVEVSRGMFDIQISATGFHTFHDQPVRGRDATFGIYDHGNPVSLERTVWFGSRTASYQYLATETRTFDILIFVDESPDIYAVKHLTIRVIPQSNRDHFTATAGPGGSISRG